MPPSNNFRFKLAHIELWLWMKPLQTSNLNSNKFTIDGWRTEEERRGDWKRKKIWCAKAEMNRKSAKGGAASLFSKCYQMTMTTCKKNQHVKKHTVSDYILSLSKHIRKHIRSERKCEKMVDFVIGIGISCHLAALHFVWICTFSIMQVFTKL